MSVMVSVATEMTNATIAKRACERRFENVRVEGNTLYGTSKKLRGRGYGVNFTINLDNLNVRYDSDYGSEVVDQINEAYSAEEVIYAAEQEGRTWHEEVNENQELVLEVEYA